MYKMTNRTLLTKEQQAEFLTQHWRNTSWQHKWSTRGYGNSKILDKRDNVIGKAGGCGYDRFGAALGNAIIEVFPDLILQLAKRECKGRRRTYKKAPKYYGLFYNAVDGKAWLDGACGSSCMEKILNKIGFSFSSVGGTNCQSNTGSEFFTLAPISKHDRANLN